MSDENNSDRLACIDCVHCTIGFWAWFFNLFPPKLNHDYKCRAILKNSSIDFDPVFGDKKGRESYTQCITNRNSDGVCGPKGKYWTAKHKRDLFKMLTKDN